MTAPLPRGTENTGRAERLFIALTLPPAIRDEVAALAEPMSGLSWTQPEQLHMTLRFLGDVPEAQVGPMMDRLATVHVEPFILPVEGVGTFPPNRPPRVLWVGAGTGHPRLFQLRQKVDDAVLASGVDMDVRTFHPHITIARCGAELSPAFPQWLHRHAEFAAASFRVEAFDLHASELRPSGAIHTLKRHFTL